MSTGNKGAVGEATQQYIDLMAAFSKAAATLDETSGVVMSFIMSRHSSPLKPPRSSRLVWP
ncbi:hypothetical protein SK128_026019 [Halocaridina rubra]|uniref:Uncharacterized protein n=1 Tax=Halocaridina rubra TaxID=373956 RepID=A0AAN9AB98_HALRR